LARSFGWLALPRLSFCSTQRSSSQALKASIRAWKLAMACNCQLLELTDFSPVILFLACLSFARVFGWIPHFTILKRIHKYGGS
jgi:hypothetical protein